LVFIANCGSVAVETERARAGAVDVRFTGPRLGQVLLDDDGRAVARVSSLVRGKDAMGREISQWTVSPLPDACPRPGYWKTRDYSVKVTWKVPHRFRLTRGEARIFADEALTRHFPFLASEALLRCRRTSSVRAVCRARLQARTEIELKGRVVIKFAVDKRRRLRWTYGIDLRRRINYCENPGGRRACGKNVRRRVRDKVVPEYLLPSSG
jgi:hypothetical protein